MARTSVQTDNFNRAGPGVGANWAMLSTSLGGNVTIDSSTRATGEYSANPAVARWVGTGSFTSNQYSGVRLVNGADALGANYWGGAIVRASADTDAARDYYCAYKQISGISNNVVLAKYLNGTATVLYSGTQSAANGDMLWLEAEGDGSSTALRVYLNDTHLTAWDYTDTTSVITGGAPGLLVCSGVFLDDWDGGNITSGGVQDLAGAAAAGAAASAQLAIAKAMAAAATGSTSSTAAIALQKNMLAAAAAQAQASGNLALAKLLGAAAQGQGLAAGALDVVGAGATITTPALKNNTGTVLAGESGITAHVYSTAGVWVATKTGETTDGAGVLAFSDAALSAGTNYRVVIVLGSGAEGMVTLAAA